MLRGDHKLLPLPIHTGQSDGQDSNLSGQKYTTQWPTPGYFQNPKRYKEKCSSRDSMNIAAV